MNRNFLLLLAALLLSLAAAAQTRATRAVADVPLAATTTGEWVSATATLPLTDAKPFLAWFVRWTGEADALQVRFSADADQWGPWEAVGLDAHRNLELGLKISQLMFAAPEQRYYQVKAAAPLSVELHCFNPGESRADARPTEGEEVEGRACPCPLPAFLNRLAWCPDGTCPTIPDPSFTTVTHLVVHHSATANTASDWAAVVRSFWDFHVNGNGWDDIGYNWLIDPNGVLYQGRGNDVVGAHYCGMNSGTMGVCVIGDFTNVTPTADAQDKLAHLLAWKACNRNLDPVGSGLHVSSGVQRMHILGHRDGCSTSCPGNAFHPLLPQVRTAVQSRIIAGCSGLPGATSLSAALVEPLTASLSWVDNTPNELGFQLQRADGQGGIFSNLATLPPNATTYQDPNLLPNTTYTYRLRAFTASDTSAYSNIASVFTLVVATSDAFFNEATVQLFPNPGHGDCQLRMDNAIFGDVQVTVLDITARQVLAERSLSKTAQVQQFTLPLASLSHGTYLLRLTHGQHTAVFRLLRQ